MNQKNLAIAFATVVFIAACDAGNNSHIKLKNYGNTYTTNNRQIGRRNYSKISRLNDGYKDNSYIASSCKEFMEYEIGIPSNSQWSSIENLTETTDGWQWEGWVDIYGERNNFVCTINGDQVTAFTRRSYSYPDNFYENRYDYKYDNKRKNSSVASSCKEFMEYEMGISRNSQWSSVEGITKTVGGWEWEGWVDIDGERNKFVCTIDNNGVNVVTNFQDSYNYEYEYSY